MLPVLIVSFAADTVAYIDTNTIDGKGGLLSYALYVDAFPHSIKSFFSLLHWVATMALHPTIKGAAVEGWGTYNHSYRDVTDSQFITCTLMALGHSLSNIYGEAVIESFRCDAVLNDVQPDRYPGSNLSLAVWVLLIGVHSLAISMKGRTRTAALLKHSTEYEITIGRFMTVVMIMRLIPMMRKANTSVTKGKMMIMTLMTLMIPAQL
jgi:hypothetical protein